MTLPPHHDPEGGFRNPWPTGALPGRSELLRWWWERAARDLGASAGDAALAPARPAAAHPRAEPDELRVTWVGHSSFLVQLGGLNLLTDPVFSRRASPLGFAGPERLTPPGIPLEALPPVDAVLLSHDHYDHLDEPTVRRLHRRFGDALRWFTPLGYGEWFGKRGILPVDMDWWEDTLLSRAAGELRIRCLPAQHWTSRTGLEGLRRLWCSWSVHVPGGRGVYFGGDSGWFPGYAEIGERAGPFDLAMLPIGGYEPREFMKPSHMNPEEAVQAYRELGARGVLAGMHWGTFRLTDEDLLEPVERTRAAWQASGLPDERLWIPRPGETRVVGPGTGPGG